MLEARFEIGQKAKYTGSSSAQMEKDGELKPFLFPGMVVEIVETHQSEEPLGQVTEEIYDNGSNGYNIGRNEHGLEIVVWPEDDWELYNPALATPSTSSTGKSGESNPEGLDCRSRKDEGDGDTAEAVSRGLGISQSGGNQ